MMDWYGIRHYSLFEGGGCERDEDDYYRTLAAGRATVEKGPDDDLWTGVVEVGPGGVESVILGEYHTLKQAKAAAVAFWRKGARMGSAFVKMGRGRLKRRPEWARGW